MRGDGHGGRNLRFGERGVGSLGKRIEQWEVEHRRQRTAAQDDRLAADFVRQPAEEHEERRGESECDRDQNVRRRAINAQGLFQKEQRVELPCIPDHRLSHHRAQQRDDHPTQVAPFGEGFGQRCLRRGAFLLHFLEDRAFIELHADPHRNAQQNDRDQERQAPAPGGKGLFAQREPEADHHQQRREQAESRRGLDPAGVEPALALGRMLGDIGRRAAIFAAQCQTLCQPQRDQNDWGSNPDRSIAGQQANREGRDAHNPHGHQERILAAHQITDPPEDDRTEGTHRKTGGKGCKRKNEPGGLVHSGKELRGNIGRKQSVEIKIIPFEHRTEGRGRNDELLPLRSFVMLW